MTLLHMDGFDLSDNIIALNYAGAPSLFSGSSSTAFGYGRSCGSGSNVAALMKSLSASSKVISGIRVLAGNGGGLAFYGDGGTTLHVYFFLTSAGTLTVYRGGGTTLASASVSPAGYWHYIEVAVTISDTVGTVEVRIDGASTPVINFSGDTKNGGTNTTIDACALYTASSSASYFDDWYICNDQGTTNNNFLGDVRVYTLAPNGNGNYSQFVGSDADSTNNYQLVDEQPYSTTDYVGSATSGNRDSYALTDLPANVTTVFGTQAHAIVAKADAGLQSIKQVIRVNSTDYETAATVLGSSYVSLFDLREQNPNTSAAWTPSDINGVEIGVRVG